MHTLKQGSGFHFDDAILVRNAKEIPTPTTSDNEEVSVFDAPHGITRELIDTDSEDDDNSAFILHSKEVRLIG